MRSSVARLKTKLERAFLGRRFVKGTNAKKPPNFEGTGSVSRSQVRLLHSLVGTLAGTGVIALFKHPLTRLNLDPERCQRAVRAAKCECGQALHLHDLRPFRHLVLLLQARDLRGERRETGRT